MDKDNLQIFGTDNYDKVQAIYENWTWGREYYYSELFDEEWREELDRRKMENDNT